MRNIVLMRMSRIITRGSFISSIRVGGGGGCTPWVICMFMDLPLSILSSAVTRGRRALHRPEYRGNRAEN